MNARKQSKLARIPLLLLDYSEQHGIDRASAMQAAGMTPGDLEDPDARVPADAVVRLWQVVIERAGRPGLGVHVGREVSAKSLGLVGYAMYYSADLRDALHCLGRYHRIVSEAVHFEIDSDESGMTVTYSAHPSIMALRHPVESALAVLLNIARELTRREVVPQRLMLPFPKDDSAQDFRHHFGIRPQFDNSAAVVVFSRDQMTLPIEASDPTLRAYLTELADTTLQSLHTEDRDLEAQVRETLLTMMPQGKPDLQRTAAAMGMSARTLQRRLHEAGSSFSTVLDEFRRGLSSDLLRTRQMAIADVAFLLGYSEPSAFRRAFRRWHNASPASYKAS